MLNAIHKKTGKRVQADKLRTDASWIGCKDDEWIAPNPEVSNWEELKIKKIFEVKVSYIKNHKSQRDGKFYMVRDHFRIITDGAKDRSENESEEHKIAKEGIYYNLIDDKVDLVFGNETKRPSMLGKFSLEIEERLSKNKNAKIGDVVMTFEKAHPLLGKGIVFEIQLSNQSEEKTEERTYDRVKQGYSVVWMWDGMFCMNELIDKELAVIPFRIAIEKYDELKSQELNEFSREIDDKIEAARFHQLNKVEEYKREIEGILSRRKVEIQLGYEDFIKGKTEEIYDSLIQNLTKKIEYDNQKVKEVIQEEVYNLADEMIKDSEELKRIEEVVRANIKVTIEKVGAEIDKKIEDEATKVLDSSGYNECLKNKFGVDLAEFARTYLDAKIYDMNKGVNK